jgi:hypothetical protein
MLPTLPLQCTDYVLILLSMGLFMDIPFSTVPYNFLPVLVSILNNLLYDLKKKKLFLRSLEKAAPLLGISVPIHP